MYSVNGIPLDNVGKGWLLLEPTRPISEIVADVISLRIPNRDGVVRLPSTFSPPPLQFVVETPRTELAALYALFTRPGAKLTVTGTAGREVAFEYVSATYEGYGAADATVELTVIIRLPGAFWRDTAETTSSAVTLGAASVSVGVFSGLSAPVGDAMVRVEGPVTGLRVEDSGGSWWAYAPSVPTGTSIAFIDGFATLSTFAYSNWDDYSEDVSGIADFNGPRGRFEITPSFSDPSSRQGSLTVKTTARGAGASIRVRGKGAYLV